MRPSLPIIPLYDKTATKSGNYFCKSPSEAAKFDEFLSETFKRNLQRCCWEWQTHLKKCDMTLDEACEKCVTRARVCRELEELKKVSQDAKNTSGSSFEFTGGDPINLDDVVTIVFAFKEMIVGLDRDQGNKSVIDNFKCAARITFWFLQQVIKRCFSAKTQCKTGLANLTANAQDLFVQAVTNAQLGEEQGSVDPNININAGSGLDDRV